jgi:hypothetical protein
MVGNQAATGFGQTFTGYISNARVVKGTAVYTAAFTPPTSPLTAISGTSLLTCQSNRFRDASTNNFAITRNGNTSVQAFSPFAPTAAYSAATVGGSGYFDGSGDYLTVPDNAVFDFGTGDFTLECWVYTTSYTGPNTDVIMSTYQDGSNGWTIGITNGVFYGAAAGDSAQLNSSVAPTASWTHLVLARSSTTLSFFVNGSRAATATNSTNMASTSAVTIGTNVGGGGLSFNGYIGGLRVVKGTAVYDPTQTTLTVPTAPLTAITNTSLLLNFTNGGIIDNTAKNVLETVGNAQISTSVKKYGTGSLAFDGTGDYLKYLGTSTAGLGSGNFTIEFWINAPSLNDKFILALRGGMSGSPHVTTGGFGGTTVGALRWASNAGEILSGTTVITDNTWHHCAIVRNGSTITLYVDGVSRGSGTDTTSFEGNGGQIYIGYNNLGGNDFTGYIDDLRITKGVARYTTTFTPPTAAFADQ